MVVFDVILLLFEFVLKTSILFFFFYLTFYFYFILLYNAVLVLPYIDMNPPQVYMRSQDFNFHFQNHGLLSMSLKLESDIFKYPLK